MKEKGLTLVEVLMATGIAVVIGGLLVAIILNTSTIFYKESSSLQEGLNINDALSKIRQTIKEAGAVSSSYTTGGTTYTSGAEQLVLNLPSIDASGNIISDNFDYFVFFKDQTKLRFKIFPNALSSRKIRDQIFTTSLDSIKFQYLNLTIPPQEVVPTSALKVRITLSLKQKNGLKYETQTATSEAGLRND